MPDVDREPVHVGLCLTSCCVRAGEEGGMARDADGQASWTSQECKWHSRGRSLPESRGAFMPTPDNSCLSVRVCLPVHKVASL